MANIILFDTPEQRENLLPLTYTRPIAEFRCGIFTLSDKWRERGQTVSFLTQDYLQAKYPVNYTDDNLYINGALFYSPEVWNVLQNLKEGEGISNGDQILAIKSSDKLEFGFETSNFKLQTSDYKFLENVWDIFKMNGDEIRTDFNWIKANGKSCGIDDKHTIAYNEDNIFVEEGADIKAAILNAEDGPIYIGKNAVVQEGSLIKGPFALCESSHVNMGGKMRGDNTVGPHSKVGGEVSNCVIFGYTNKGHDGFIGNSVIGEWCNLGADTNTSNLKNNYAEVRLWNYKKGGFVKTGQQFCGLIMGDHSKCGINTMFNTGTVVGVNSNIFGSGFPRNFVPSYAWGGASGFTTYQTRKAFEVAEVVMSRRKLDFTEEDKNILTKVFETTSEYRIWES